MEVDWNQMRLSTQLTFAAIISLTVISVGLVFLTQLHLPKAVPEKNVHESESASFAGAENFPEPSATSQPIQLLFGGDLMFDRNIRLRMQEHGIMYPLAQLTDMFVQYDAVIANLEGPVTTNSSLSVGSVPGSTNNFYFTFQPEVVSMLVANNISIVNIGNNHILNFGVDGIAQTRELLKAGGVDFFGNTGLETSSAERVHIHQFADTTVAFVNLNQFTQNGFATALMDTVTASASADIVIAHARRTHQNGDQTMIGKLLEAHPIDTDNEKLNFRNNKIRESAVPGLTIVGFETTALVLQRFIFQLSHSPELYSQLVTAIESDDEQFLENVFFELTRLHPGIPRLPRVLNQDMVFEKDGKRFLIPKGTMLTFLIHAANKDPRFWGTEHNPNEFHPERWNAFRRNGTGSLSFPPFFFSFGAGNTQCTGPQFALLEFKTFVTEMMRYRGVFTIQPLGTDKAHIDWVISEHVQESILAVLSSPSVKDSLL